MDQDRKLDPPGHPILILRPSFRRVFRAVSSLIAASIFLASVSSCSLPKVIILKDPLTPEEHLNLGVSYERQGELSGALREYEKAAKELPLGDLYLGNVYLQQKEWGRAEKSYRRAMRRDPQLADAYNNLAWLYYLKREKPDEAEKLARKAVELNPGKKGIYEDTLHKIEEWQRKRKNQ